MRSWQRKGGQASGASNDFSAIAATLDIPVPFTAEKLCESIASGRGRPIHIHAIEHEGSSNKAPCGAWIALDKADHIFVENATSPLHRSHIILHELCHMLLGHSCLPTDEHEAPAVSAQHRSLAEVLSVEEWAGFPINRIVSLLGRTSYTHVDEQAAEGLAGVIARRIRQAEEAARGPADPLSNHLLNALIE
ncbi:hypothetical protein [Streptacidiphilus sp. P02-A3a]|uniref:hypothetical protein n=1 Tax=Streptacidiphilus sp. P02-A3a TaxID=2704468 RepID=UPI0015FA7CA5|nr:hypothetical protein [Streptacidiphilus sp. P02-A3a]QMU67284.1 hypothetical protein GXP74_02735 [Streptacidiphilus sp. P02-A3a]